MKVIYLVIGSYSGESGYKIAKAFEDERMALGELDYVNRIDTVSGMEWEIKEVELY